MQSQSRRRFSQRKGSCGSSDLSEVKTFENGKGE